MASLQPASVLCVSGMDHLTFCVRFHGGLILHAEIGVFGGVLHTDLSKEPTHLIVFPALRQTSGLGHGSVAVTEPLSWRLQWQEVANSGGVLDAVESPLNLSPIK